MDPAWLKEELAKPGRSQSALARHLGWTDASKVNRIVNGQRQIRATEADAIRAYLIATGGSDSLPLQNHVASPQFVPVLGTVEAGVWREVGVAEGEPEYIPVVAHKMFAGDVFAVRVVGSSMNEFYADGAYVIARKWGGGDLPVGRHVIVQREQPSGLYETTLKELVQRDDGGLELWPRSTDPRHQSPVRYDEHENATVKIIGRVIAKMEFVE